MQIVRMHDAFSQPGRVGSVPDTVSKGHFRIGWLDGLDHHLTHRTAGDSLDQVGGCRLLPVEDEWWMNELMCSADQMLYLDRLGALLLRAGRPSARRCGKVTFGGSAIGDVQLAEKGRPEKVDQTPLSLLLALNSSQGGLCE